MRVATDNFTDIFLSAVSNVVFSNGQAAYALTTKNDPLNLAGLDYSEAATSLSVVGQADVDYMVASHKSVRAGLECGGDNGLLYDSDSRSIIPNRRIVLPFALIKAVRTVSWCGWRTSLQNSE